MGKAGERGDFEWVYDEQPHTWRRKEILGRSASLKSLEISDSFLVTFQNKKIGNYRLTRAGVSNLTPLSLI